MTDKDIIKALECCKKDDCDNCPNDFGNCYTNLAVCSHDLINRQKTEYNNLLEQFRILDCECEHLENADENQKAEIKGLKIENQSLRLAANSYKIHYGKAVRDFEEFAQ